MLPPVPATIPPEPPGPIRLSDPVTSAASDPPISSGWPSGVTSPATIVSVRVTVEDTP